MKGKDRGAVSVYLAMMMAVMIPLILTMMEAARVNAIKLRMECAADLSMDSVLAEYNRALMDRYDLLFIDTAYDGGNGSVDKLTEHLEKYLEYNIRPSKGNIFGGKDLTGLQLESAELVRVSRATDGGGEVFRYMALSYMLEKYGLSYVEGIKDMVESSSSEELFSTDVSEELNNAQGAVDAFPVPEPPEEQEEGTEWEEPPSKDDPAGAVRSAAGKGFLVGQAVKDEISGAAVDTGVYASHRSLVKGDGMPEDWEDRNSILEYLLFNEYIMEKCANYCEPKEGCRLQYRTEYILCGNNSDKDNLEGTAFKLMLIRGGSNFIYFFSDEELKSEAKTLATALSFVCFCPQAAQVFELLIDIAWIYAETINDLKILFKGGKVPVFKSKQDWKLSLTNALGMGSDDEGEGNGQDYGDYLRIFLFLTPIEDRTARCMDIVEMDVRQAGYEDFRLDNCVAGATVQLVFRSRYGYSFLMERRFRYA